VRIINYTPSRSVCGRNTTRLRGICRFLWLSSSSAFQQRSTRSLCARSPARLIANRRRLASKQRWRRTVVPEPWLVVLYRRRVGRLFDGLTTMYPALPSYYTYLPLSPSPDRSFINAHRPRSPRSSPCRLLDSGAAAAVAAATGSH